MKLSPAIALICTITTAAPAYAANGVRTIDDPRLEVRAVTTPEVGREAEVEVGQTMLSVDPVELTTAINLRTAASAKFKVRIAVEPGILLLRGQDDDGDFYEQRPRIELITFGIKQPSARGGVYVPRDGGNPQLYWEGDPGRAFTFDTEGVEFERTSFTRKPAKALRRELVYSGASKGVVKILYREFLDDMARPAFSQDLTYDLADGDEIGFRGARVKVSAATNTSIRFTVVRPFEPSR